MKFKTLIMSAMAILAVAAGCKPEELDGTKLSLAVEGAEENVLSVAKERSEVAITVTADCKWAVSTDVEWITFSKTEGSGNGTVQMYVEANEKAAREALVHFQKADTRKVSADFTVKQAAGYEIEEGDGTLEHPYLASQASAVCAGLESGATTADKVYVKGYVKKFASKHADGIASYGNALFYITDDPDGQVTPDFYCYQVYYLKGQKFTSEDQIKLGDEVVVYGQLTNYNGTYETVGKGAAYCYSINGKTDAGDTPVPSDVIDVTVAEFLAAPESTTQYYRIKGTVSGAINTQYGNFDVTDATGSVYVFGLTNIEDVREKLVSGAEITVVGHRKIYKKEGQADKDEMTDAICEKIENGDEPDPSTILDVTVEEFNAAEVSTTQLYRLKGTVGGSINTQYGNFDLTDATGTVYVYGLSNITEVKDKLLNNAQITVVGYRGDYNGKIEVLNGKCESISGGDEPDPSTGTYDSEFKWTLGTNAYDQEATINGESVAHVLKLGTSKATGTATITIPAGVSAVEFYAYAWKGATAKLTVKMGTISQSYDIKANDGCTGNPPYTITASASDKYVIDLGTTLTSAVDVTVEHETARVVIFGLKSSDGTEPGPGPDPSEVKDVTVAQFTAAEVSTTQLYRLKGKVSGITNTTYGNFDLTDATGTVYVYGLSNIADVREKLLNNAEITIVGYRGEYNGTVEVMNGECESIEGGDVPEPVGGVFYTLDTSLDSALGAQNGYATCEENPVVVDGIGWNAYGNLTMKPWRIGGKSLSAVERTAWTTTGMTKAVSKVVFTCGNNSGVTIDSAKLLYGLKEDFSDAKEASFEVTKGASVEIPVSAASGSYFKFVFTITQSSSSNKYFEFSKVEFAE